MPSSPVLDEPLVSPSISAVGAGEEVVPLMMMVDEDEVSLPLWVHGQRAWRSQPFQVNMPADCSGLALCQSHGPAEGQWQHCRWGEMPGPHEQ